MFPRAVPVTAVAAAALSLLLAGCSGDDDTSPSGKSQGLGTVELSPSLSLSDEAAAGPEIRLPADLKVTFDPEETGDPVKDAVLRGNAERMKAVFAAIVGQDPNDDALSYYNIGRARAETSDWVGEFKEEKLTVTGDVHYLDRKVTLNEDGAATLTFCADESEGFSKSLETGKVYVTPVTENSYVYYRAELQKSEHGVWRTADISSERGAAECQP